MKAIITLIFLLPSVLFTQNSDWAYRNTNPQTNFYGIKFFDQNTGYVIGSGGAFLKNVTGSDNWINIATYTSRDLFAMHFFNMSTGYIVGDGGIILYTSNGGANWTTIATTNNYALRSVKFINHNTGFIAGDNGALYKTTSGITGWQQLNVTSANLRYIYFYDSLTGYVCGDSGKFLKTTNCGLNWSVQTVGTENLLSVAFINSLTGYLTPRLGGLKTTNGGNNWFTSQVGYAGQENFVKFTDANTGYVYGKNGPVSRTTNGGSVWQPWCSYQLFSGNSFYDISIVDSNTAFLCGKNGWIIKCIGTDQVNQNAYNLGGSLANLSRINFTDALNGAVMSIDGSLLFTTSNGGDKWNVIFCGTNSWFEGSSSLTDLWLFSQNSWYREIYYPGIGGFPSFSVQQSTDQGLTWAGPRNYGSMGYGVSDIFETGGVTYLTNSFSVLKNSGANWATVYTGSTTGKIYFADANTGFVSIGASGIRGILFTSNGGTNWIIYSTGSTKYIESVYLRPSGLGFVGCDSSLLLRTTNFGLNWSQITVPNNLRVQNIRFVNENTGWFMATNRNSPYTGRLYVTNNGGTSFQQMMSLMNFDVKGYSFVDVQNGFICGDSGKVIKTTNGGLTFVTHYPGITPDKYSLSQNYPNPFNPVTNIKFDIPKSGFVKITVYDLLGREITTLVNEQMKPGSYNVDWDASNYSSGVYFYKIEAGDPSTGSGRSFVVSRKMVLIK
ncbi:MAG: T9SS type A sorting domain-containing protein [Ignavibacteria bacterium]|nr:T9SS type A sorting domain-containing protein [Ignavibacteria bacterium]